MLSILPILCPALLGLRVCPSASRTNRVGTTSCAESPGTPLHLWVWRLWEKGDTGNSLFACWRFLCSMKFFILGFLSVHMFLGIRDGKGCRAVPHTQLWGVSDAQATAEEVTGGSSLVCVCGGGACNSKASRGFFWGTISLRPALSSTHCPPAPSVCSVHREDLPETPVHPHFRLDLMTSEFGRIGQPK